MGNRSKRRECGWHGFDRAYKDKCRKRAAHKQKKHLKSIKTEQELRAITLGSRHL